mgnify:CR=1 FL=1|tara:strand:- start:127 stop:600 length:474 start_codon:yes stop_codon:yes gene_type:complete
MEDRLFSAVQYLDRDVSQMISETYLPDKVAKYTLDYTLKVFLKDNYVMGMRSGALESCRPSNIPRKIPYDHTRTPKMKRNVHNIIAMGYVKEARNLAKKIRAIRKLRETLPDCEIEEYEVGVPEHRRDVLRRRPHDIEWRGMKIKFDLYHAGRELSN